MVFESVVTDVLNKVLGDYIENLDRKQLKIGIWGGDVVLENLKIRENALDDMDLPVRLVHGFLGKIVLKIPWKNLYSQPVIVSIEDLYALVTPHQNVQYDPSKEEKYEQQTKQAALDALEAARKKELTDGAEQANAGFAEKLTMQIVNNLQIKISNVHIRYEDNTTTSKFFSFGVSLHELELYTTDINWEKCYMTEHAAQVFKIANLSCLSVYMNCHGQLNLDGHAESMANLFRTKIARKDFKPENYSYVLGPICCIAKLKMNLNPEFDNPPFVIPKIDLCLEMEKLNVGLTNSQFQNIIQLADSMNRSQLAMPYRQYRPYNIPYKGHAKEWWQFAITAVLEHDVRRSTRTWTWKHIKAHRDRCHIYAQKYKERELNKKPTKVLLESCKLLEEKLDVFNLLLIRQRVNIEIAKEREAPVEKAGWFSGWWGGNSDKKEDEGDNIVRKFQMAMTLDEKAKMYSAIGYEENFKPMDMPESFVAIKMNFKLVALEIGLYKEPNIDESNSLINFNYDTLPSILMLKFSMATATISQRPGANALSVTAGMKELIMTGVRREDYTPLLIQSITMDDFNLLDIFFETNPLDKLCDQRVKVVARPLQITYDAETIINFLDVFKPPNDVNLSKFEETAGMKLTEMKERSATGMQYIIDQKTILDADILLMPNVIVIPYGGFYKPDDIDLIVVSLGEVHITSESHHQSETPSLEEFESEDEAKQSMLKNVMDNAYDRFYVRINDIQILMVRPEEHWQRALKMATSTEMHILQPASVEIIAALCVVDMDPRMPKMKVDINLPSVHLSFTDNRVLETLGVITSLPMPQKTELQKYEPVLERSRSSISTFINREVKRRTTIPSSFSSSGVEIIQYTNMEINFSLTEISIFLNQSRQAVTEDPSFETPDEGPKSDIESTDSSATGSSMDNELDSKQVLSLKILQVEVNMSQRTYETVVMLKLGGINIRHYDCQGKNNNILDIIDTPGFCKDSNYLLTVSYQLAEKSSPEFATKYNSVEQLVVANFEVLNIVLHQECLLKLLQIVNKFQSRMDMILMDSAPTDRYGNAGAGDGMTQRLTVIIEEAENVVKRTRSKQSKRSTVIESIKMRFIANLNEVSLTLTTRSRPLAAMFIKKLVSNVTLKDSYTELNIGLKDIIVNDLNPRTIHKNILSMVGQDAFNCQLVIYNKDFTHDYNSDDLKLTVDIGCMKIIFLNWFVAGVSNFLNKFKAAQKALSEASAAAAETARQNAMDAYENETRMKLNIRIKAPIILIPIDSKSTNALALDLGLLELTNNTSELEVPDLDRMATIDEIKLQIKDVKLTRVTILDENELQAINSNESQDAVDAAVGIRSALNMMNPMSFTLSITRNLSSSWYTDIPELNLSGHLKSIELTLFSDDYTLMMSIANHNLAEGVEEFPPEEPEIVIEDRFSRRTTTNPSRSYASHYSKLPKQKIYEALKLNFQFDGVIINLMESEDSGLACFGIYFLSVKGTKLSNDTMSISTVLCNIQLDDTRKSNKSKIRRYLTCKNWDSQLTKAETLQICQDQVPQYMVNVTLIMKPNDTFAEISIRSFDLIVCIDFMLKLSSFLALPPSDDEPIFTESPAALALGGARATRATVRELTGITTVSKDKMNLILHIEEPDIIVIESLNDLNANAIIFNAKVNLNFRSIGEKQLINGQINGLKIYMCSFLPERRSLTRHYILHPTIVSLEGSTPDEEGMHISLKLSDIIINISPATIELITKALHSISSGSAEKIAIQKDHQDFSNMWYPKKINPKAYWFTKVDQGQEALEYEGERMGRHKTEKCVIEVPSVTIVFESGMGYYTKPLISLDSRMTAVFNNWSRSLSAHGSLTLNMNYYNQVLAEWEPIIELNEVIGRAGFSEYIPWELQFDLSIDKTQNEFDEDLEENTTNIRIHSKETLEITLSKTCVSLLSELGEAFFQAMDAKKGLAKPEIVAPYVVENDTGFDITLDLRPGVFTLHEVHRGATILNQTLILHSIDAGEELVNPEDIKICTISPGGRVYLQTKDFSTIPADQADDYNLYVKVGNINYEVVLPVSKADMRYFELMRDTEESWGVVSKITHEYGTTRVNIHGILGIHNHFTTPIKVYRRKESDNSEIYLGQANPGKVFNVPLHCIYAERNELYFSLKGYQTSVQGIEWSINPSDFNYSCQTQCDPIDTFEALYINVVRNKAEIYFENTDKYRIASVFYTLHLRPPLYLRNELPIDIKVSVAGCSVRKNVVDERQLTETPGRFKQEDFLDYGEKEINPGAVLHLPTVRTIENAHEKKSVLVVRLCQYLEKDWSYATEIADYENDDVSIWKFSSYDSEIKMEMDLYVRSANRYGSLSLSIYSPFWMINKTGKMLTYKTELSSLEVLYHPSEYAGPILFTYRDKMFFDKKKTAIRVDSGEWSAKIPLDVAGSIGGVACLANEQTYHIGVHNHLTHNSLTKMITFIPFYIVRNKCSFPIELQEFSRPGDKWLLLEPAQLEPLWPKSDVTSGMIVRVENQITPAFDYSEASHTLLRLKDCRYGGVNVDVQSTEGGVYITFTQYQNYEAPGLLINHTSRNMRYHEKDSAEEHILRPKHKVYFAWDNPMGSRILVFGKEKHETDLKRDQIDTITLSDNNTTAYCVSFLDGMQRVLLFTEIESIAVRTESTSALQTITQSIELHIYGIGLSVVNNEANKDILYLGINSSGIIWESKKQEKTRFREMTIQESEQLEAEYQSYLVHKEVGERNSYFLNNRFPINFDKMILTKQCPRMLQRSFNPAIWISMKSSSFQNQLHVKINNVQVDNQLIDPIFAVVLAQIAPPKSVTTDACLKPFMECSIVQRIIPNSSVKQFKYASVLIQEFHFKVDIMFLTAIVEMFSTVVRDEQAAKLLRADVESIQQPLSDIFELHSLQEQKNYYDNLHLGPLKIHVSFSMAGSSTKALPGLFGALVRGVGVTLTDANDVVFRLAFFEREYQFFTQNQLISEVTSHYTGQALKQLYVLALGLDVLGNPYGLVVGLKKGVEDLFYEPFQGAIQGPGEFAEGLVLGVKSLFGHTVGGAAGAMSKITGAMGKGLAALTFDDEYQRKRRRGIHNKPKNFHEGLARSGKGLVMGFVDGVTGVVTKPVKGAQEQGVEGFFKGLGKGAIGLVARPTAGVVDFASGSFDAVKRATEGSTEPKRLRPTRFLYYDTVLRPYCRGEAIGNRILREVDKGKFASTDSFIHCEEVVPTFEYLLVTNNRVIYTQRNDMFGMWASLWHYQWEQIDALAVTPRGVHFTLKPEGKRVLGLFKSNESTKKLVLVSDERRRQILVDIMESQREDYDVSTQRVASTRYQHLS